MLSIYLLEQKIQKHYFINLMLYLEFLEGQGLGNQLWNYVTLRSLSKELGLGYEIINSKRFKGKDFLDISYSKSAIKSNLKNHRKKYNIFNEKIFYDYELRTFACDFDNDILKVQPNTLIKGLFQSEKYFFNNDINEFIKLKLSNMNKLPLSSNQCLLNIRGGEYKRHRNLILPKSYWLSAIKNMKKINPDLEFSIITDDYDYSSKLFPELKIIKGNISQDYFQIFSTEYVIVSNSSFSYFPISLGKKPKVIIAPSLWARFGNSKERWISPANYYKNWKYQNDKGEIISTKTSEKMIKKTKEIYLTYNVLTKKESLQRKTILTLIPSNFKKLIKKIISKIFPLHIG